MNITVKVGDRKARIVAFITEPAFTNPYNGDIQWPETKAVVVYADTGAVRVESLFDVKEVAK